MELLDYTTFAEVRAVLGVSDTELTDATLAQPQWDMVLTLSLEDINEELPALYDTVSALPKVSRTSNQQRFYDLTRLYASYSLAKSLLTSLPMFSVAQLTDGRAGFQRFADVVQDVRDGVDAGYSALRTRLTNIYAKLDTTAGTYTSATLVYAVSTGLGVNPVTNA